MASGFLESIMAFLRNAHQVNFVSLAAGAFAGLYGYQFLGRGGRVLRQGFVVAPAALGTGIFYVVIDAQTHYAYSEVMRNWLPLPEAMRAWALFPAFGVGVSLLSILVNPNTFREHAHTLSRWRQVGAGVLQTIEFGALMSVSIAVNMVRLSWFADWRPPFPVFPFFVLLSVAVGSVGAYLTVSRSFRHALVHLLTWVYGRWPLDESPETIGALLRFAFWSVVALTIIVLVVVALLSFILGYALLLFTYAAQVMGWTFWLLFAVYAFASYVGIYFQRAVDAGIANTADAAEQQSQLFLYVSFACFVVAAGLQIYQALAFPS